MLDSVIVITAGSVVGGLVVISPVWFVVSFGSDDSVLQAGTEIKIETTHKINSKSYRKMRALSAWRSPFVKNEHKTREGSAFPFFYHQNLNFLKM